MILFLSIFSWTGLVAFYIYVTIYLLVDCKKKFSKLGGALMIVFLYSAQIWLMWRYDIR